MWKRDKEKLLQFIKILLISDFLLLPLLQVKIHDDTFCFKRKVRSNELWSLKVFTTNLFITYRVVSIF